MGRFLDKYLITVRDKYTNRTLGDFEPYELGLTQRTADVVIFKDGDKAVAYNWKGEKIIESDEHYEVIQESINETPLNGIMKIIGEYNINKIITINRSGITIDLRGAALILGSENNDGIFKIGYGSSRIYNISIYGGSLKGISGTSAKGIQVSNATGIEIIGLSAYYFDTGILFDGSAAGVVKEVNVLRCLIYLCTGSCVKLVNTWEGRIGLNRLHDAAFPVHLQGSGEIEVLHNRIWDNTDVCNIGLYIYSGNHINIIGNIISDALYQGIRIDGTGAERYIKIVGVEVVNCSKQSDGGYSGILLNDVLRTSVCSSHIINMTTDRRHKYGIEEISGSDYNLIMGNQITGYLSGDIYLVGSNSISVNNIS